MDLADVNEKLQRKGSFTAAVLGAAPPARAGGGAAAQDGPAKEHSEQGRVKRDVYVRYVEAASGIGFALFVGATVLSQIVSVAANNTLRAWGEHNREEGSNRGVGRYLLGYGLFSLASTLLGAAAAILIWVFCSIRSARRLHDSVRTCLSLLGDNAHCVFRCFMRSCGRRCRSSNKRLLAGAFNSLVCRVCVY